MSKLIKIILCVGLFPLSSILNNTYCMEQKPNEKSKFLIDKISKPNIKNNLENSILKNSAYDDTCMTVELVSEQDLQDMKDTFKRCFSYGGYSLGDDTTVKAYFEADCIYKYVKNKENVAYAIVWNNVQDEVSEIKWFFVKPEFGKSGHGTHFLKKLGDILVTKFTRKTIRISSTPQSEKFYTKFSKSGESIYRQLGTNVFLYYPKIGEQINDEEDYEIDYNPDEYEYENISEECNN